MSVFLQSQLDFICLLCGLAFLVLWAACLVGRRGEDSIPWQWLGWFALAHGMVEWMGLVGLSVGDGMAFTGTRTILLVCSFLFLAEFARGAAAVLWRRTPGRWILLPLLGLAASGAFLDGWTGLNVSCRCALGFVGAAVSGSALILLARRMPAAMGLRLGGMGMTLGLYAIAAGLVAPKAAFWPVSWLNDECFLQTLHLPVQLVRGMLAVAVAILFRQYHRAACGANPDQPRVLVKNAMASWLPILLVLVLAAGWGATQWVGRDEEAQRRVYVRTRAMTAAAAVSAERVRSLQCSPKDEGTENFTSLREQLKAVRKVNPDTRFVYLTRQVGGKVFFLADAEPVDSKDYSPPGSVYDSVTEGFAGVFRDGLAATEGPMTDAWGTWISGLAPLKNPATGKVEAVLGMDIAATDWARGVALARLGPIAITGLVSLMLIGFYGAARRLRDSAERIAESRQRYRSLVEGSPNTVALFDRSGRYVALNSSGLKAMGWTKAQMLGRSYEEIWPESVRWVVRNAMERALSGERVSFEASCRRPDGGMGTWDVTLNPVVDADGQVRRFVGVSVDVTERRAIEKALRQREERLQLVFSGSSDGFWDWNLPTGETFFSARLVEMLGYRHDDFIPHISSWERLIHPDDAPAANAALADHLEGRTEQYEAHYRVATKTGGWRWVLSRGKVVARGAQGQAVRMAGVNTDITDRKEAEEKLRATVSELERFNKLALGREKRVIELKATANELLARLGEPLRYAVAPVAPSAHPVQETKA